MSADDTAGPLVGWSLGSGVGTRRIHDLVTFPCTFQFKAVGRAGFLAALLERVGTVLGRAVRGDEQSVRSSKNGAYASVTLSLWVTSGDEVYSIYEALSDDERVKFVL